MSIEFDAATLTQELLDAGLPVQGADSDGVILWASAPTDPQKTAADAVKAQHDPSQGRQKDEQSRGRNWQRAVEILEQKIVALEARVAVLEGRSLKDMATGQH